MTSSKALCLDIDLRKEIKEHLTVKVQMKNILWVKIGLVFIKIGCYLSGANFVEEFPMSLIQKDDPERYTSYDFIRNAENWLEDHKNDQ